ncbi:MAG: hypothetical protein JST39_25020 [Bacteroidetes bacterium]|nr:hypothetical protein [Bacteroidota bacterium]
MKKNSAREKPPQTAGKEGAPEETGKKAIEISKKTDGKPPEQWEKDEKKDAERWRNEG